MRVLTVLSRLLFFSSSCLLISWAAWKSGVWDEVGMEFGPTCALTVTDQTTLVARGWNSDGFCSWYARAASDSPIKGPGIAEQSMCNFDYRDIRLAVYTVPPDFMLPGATDPSLCDAMLSGLAGQGSGT